MVLGESAGVAAAMAVDAVIPVQDVPYKECEELDALEQTLDRIPAQDPDQKKAEQSARWSSQEQWNKQKPGYEWLFPTSTPTPTARSRPKSTTLPEVQSRA